MRRASSATVGILVATDGSPAVVAANVRDRAEHLTRAVQGSREIGLAMGAGIALFGSGGAG